MASLICFIPEKNGNRAGGAMDPEQGKNPWYEMAALNIEADAFHPEWNYAIKPRPREAPS
jgi:hypothetical protein